jgi:chromosome segregation ATPase
MSESIEQQAQRQIEAVMDLFAPDFHTALWDMSDAEQLLVTLRALLAELARVKQRLEDVYLKDRGKTNEINILTSENRELSAPLAAVRAELERVQEREQAIIESHHDASDQLAAVRAALGEIEQEIEEFRASSDTRWEMSRMLKALKHWRDRLAVLRLGKDGE